MKTLILFATLFLTVPLIGQEYHNVKIYKYVKKYHRDTLVQESLVNTSISIDTTNKLVKFYAKEDYFLIRGIWLKKIGPNQYEFNRKIDWHPLTYVLCQMEIQQGKISLYTHYNYRLKKFKYRLVFY